MNEKNLISSLAVFRELYDEEADIYDVIASFIDALIQEDKLISFGLTDISIKFNKKYEFNVPSAVIKTALKRLTYVTKQANLYFVNNSESKKFNVLINSKATIESSHEEIFNRLNEYVESKKKIKLKEKDVNKLHHQFCDYLLDQSKNEDDEYMEYISSFIVFCQNDKNILEKIRIIREGVILYAGIKYTNDTDNFSSFGNWRKELKIFLDTEIIFHLIGYNGNIYKEIAEEFLKFTREINSKNKQKKLIQLCYFPDVKDEIDNFFYKAKYILNGQEILNPKVTAMVEILNGCSTYSDLQSKKSDLYTFLNKYGIEEFNDHIDITDSRNYKFNILSNDVIEEVNTYLKINNSENLLTTFNNISILRSNSSESNFEDVGYILLTGNSDTLRVAFNTSISSTCKIPLATSLNFVINRLWFKLNKGLSQKNFPSSYSILAKAQIILSTVLNESIGDKFDELKAMYKFGKITKEQAENRVRDLRKKAKKPEEINQETNDDLIGFITTDSIERYIEEQSYYKEKVKEFEVISEELKDSQARSTALMEQLKQTKIEKIDEYQRIINDFNRQQTDAQDYAEKCLHKIKSFMVIFVFIYYGGIVALICYIGWETMEPLTYIMGIPMSVIISIAKLFKKQIKLDYVITSIKAHIAEKKLKKISKYSADEIEKFKNEIDKIEDEIANME